MSRKQPPLAATIGTLDEAAGQGVAIDLSGLAVAVEKLCTEAMTAPPEERQQAAQGLAAVVAALDRLGRTLKQQQELTAKAAHRRAADAYKA